jgi:hypothetical protein
MRMVHASPGHALIRRAPVVRVQSARVSPKNMPKTALVDSQRQLR